MHRINNPFEGERGLMPSEKPRQPDRTGETTLNHIGENTTVFSVIEACQTKDAERDKTTVNKTETLILGIKSAQRNKI